MLSAAPHIGTSFPYNEAVYIYQLEDDRGPFYIGSSVNPASRLLGHLALKTKDTAPRISGLLALGERPRMTILDVTTREHRLALESRWIHATPTAINSTRYRAVSLDYKTCPTCYRAASTSTLGHTVPIPDKKPTKRRVADFLFLSETLGEEVARRSDPAARAWWMRCRMT